MGLTSNGVKKISKILILSFTFVLFFLVTPAVFAAPSISGVGGTTSHGNTITISGANFGAKSPAKPFVWAPFEGGALSADSSLSSGSILSTSNMSLSSADPSHSRSTAATRGIPYTASPYTKAGPQMWITPNSSIVDMFVFLRRKYAHASYWDTNGVNNYKFYRFWPPSGTLYPDYVGVFSNTNRITRFAPEGAPGPVGVASGFTAPQNAWFTEELQVHQGGIDTPDSTTKFWTNSVLKISYSHISRDSDSPAQWSRLSIENFWTLIPPPSGAYMYFDDIYVDTTWSRVMIGNASTFEASTHREPLIPTAWSGNSITAYFNQGSFTNGSQAYIFVVDAGGNVSPGRAITISGTPPPTCTSFTYSAWDACQADNTQTRTVSSSSPAGCTGGNPVPSQSCTYTPPAQSCGDQSCNNGETCTTCPGDCGTCPITPPPVKTYNLSDFTKLVTDWLKSITGSPVDINADGKVNSKDLGIMMSNWTL